MNRTRFQERIALMFPFASHSNPRKAPRRPRAVRPTVLTLEPRLVLSAVTVNTTLDVIDPPHSLRVSLRDAINDVNAGTANTINLPSGTYNITIPGSNEYANKTGDFDILPSTNVTIQGIGASPSVINAGGLDRAFAILPKANVTVTFQNLEITGGAVSSGDASSLVGNAYGGGIDVIDTAAAVGNVALVNTTVTGNASYGGGGGIATIYGNVTLTNSQVTSNSTAGDGGGVETQYGNISLSGGGVGTQYGKVSLSGSVVSNNTSSEYGGGLSDEGKAGSSNITLAANSQVVNNAAYHYGGGIYDLDTSGTLTVRNSTVSGNVAEDDYGGGVYTADATVTITGSHLDSNITDIEGGGLYLAGSGVTLTVTSSTMNYDTASRASAH